MVVFAKRFGLLALLLGIWGWPLLVLAQTGEAPPTPTPIPTTAPAAPAATAAPPAEEENEPALPQSHVIAEGESLVYLADLYSTTVEALQLANDIADPELIFIGQEIFIPGDVGSEVPAVYFVAAGDTLAGIAARFNTTPAEIAAGSGLINRQRLYLGQRLPLLSRTGTPNPLPLTGEPHVVRPGETLLAIAATYNLSPTRLIELNQLGYPARLYPGQRLRLPGEQPYQFLPDAWLTVDLQPAALRQGDTLSIRVSHQESGVPLGEIIAPDGTARPLRFSPAPNGGFEAIAGFDAFAQAGRYTLRLSGEGVARPWLPFEQDLVVQDGGYGLQNIVVDESLAPLLAPEVRADEDAFLNTIFTASDPERLWTGAFIEPVENSFVTAGYGDGRSYNGGPVTIFHSGIDFGGTIGTPIVAPAAGRIVYSDTLELRGGALIIDHGGGVMTAYYHLSRIVVPPGEVVAPGQKVAEGGNTGLSTGPHLHWDLRVWGVAVDPAPWLRGEVLGER